MTDSVTANTAIVTRQLIEKGTEELISKDGFLLTDILISSTSQGQVTLIATDDEHTHIIVSIIGEQTFSHNFTGGWVFWKDARLEVVKEIDDGEVNVSIGFVRTRNMMNYNQWFWRGN